MKKGEAGGRLAEHMKTLGASLRVSVKLTVHNVGVFRGW